MTAIEQPQVDTSLHLPSLSIKGFRGIDELTLPRLGRVTLLTGKNSVGKTTVLEAVHAFSARGRFRVLHELLTDRQEVSTGTDEAGDSFTEDDLSALFYGRLPSEATEISIGPLGDVPSLMMKVGARSEDETPGKRRVRGRSEGPSVRGLEVTFDNQSDFFPWHYVRDYPGSPGSLRLRLNAGEQLPPVLECERIGPGVLTNQELAQYLDRVALTEGEQRAAEALGLIFSNGVERFAATGEGIRRGHGRRLIVRMREDTQPIPLNSLGDGAVRLSGVALALANSRNGFLLIDEAENGLHHSIQQDYWRMILKASRDNNVQVIATTHSWDCVRSFARAAIEDEEVDGVLYRIEKDADGLFAVAYSEEELHNAAEYGTEVR